MTLDVGTNKTCRQCHEAPATHRVNRAGWVYVSHRYPNAYCFACAWDLSGGKYKTPEPVATPRIPEHAALSEAYERGALTQEELLGTWTKVWDDARAAEAVAS